MKGTMLQLAAALLALGGCSFFAKISSRPANMPADARPLGDGSRYWAYADRQVISEMRSRINTRGDQACLFTAVDQHGVARTYLANDRDSDVRGENELLCSLLKAGDTAFVDVVADTRDSSRTYTWRGAKSGPGVAPAITPQQQ